MSERGRGPQLHLAERSSHLHQSFSLYLEAGAIHGCVLCQEGRPLVYMEDVGRHNAVDKIAGWMVLNDIPAHDKIYCAA